MSQWSHTEIRNHRSLSDIGELVPGWRLLLPYLRRNYWAEL